MEIRILTIFLRLFEGFFGETMMKRAVKGGHLRARVVDLREFSTDKHRTTDDTPYGGGPGMVMKIEPIFNALHSLKTPSHVVLLSPRGRQFSQAVAQEYAQLETLTLICGRYEGVDQRVADHLAHEELSIGPYVLSGGEVAAMVVTETVVRLLPGVLGNPESLKEETFSAALPREGRLRRPKGEYPQYTKPETFQEWSVPEVLLSGDHAKIAEWRKKHT